MRLIAGENFPRLAVERLREDGHDVLWIRTEMPGVSDVAIITKAAADQRLLLTQDKDFGEIVFAQGYKQSIVGVVLFRLAAPSPAILARRIAAAIESGSNFLGHFAVVEDARIRLQPLYENHNFATEHSALAFDRLPSL